MHTGVAREGGFLKRSSADAGEVIKKDPGQQEGNKSITTQSTAGPAGATFLGICGMGSQGPACRRVTLGGQRPRQEGGKWLGVTVSDEGLPSSCRDPTLSELTDLAPKGEHRGPSPSRVLPNLG